ncbi:hypothetical protein F444_11521 [Phytophthora nicotianae P1976]|uniref:Uncharacterized protein n=1 Tax=Phytophthora nicotianae P1976 TaxID=1317066 RepID=A0A081A0D8_PHYNI|nr:hypothetical protein F444_11521 [Phytophthora nicotianae P1976]
MTSKTWSGKLVQVRANYHKQKTFDGPYVVHLLLHAANEVRQGIRRVTPARIAEAADAIDTYLAERSDVRVGDAMSAARQENDREEGVYRTLMVSLNGLRDMQLTFNIEELRTVLQLPNYSLIALGLFSKFQPQREPAVDMEYVNHLSDSKASW